MRNISAALAVLTALIFAASAAREWAYYHVIGADFVSLTSPADYTSGALHWLPTFVLAGTVIAVIEMFLSRTEGFQSEEEIAQSSPNPKRTMFLRALPWRTLSVLMIVGGVLKTATLVWLVLNPTAMDWVTSVGLFWIVFSGWFTRHPLIFDRLKSTGRVLLVLGPFGAASIIAGGYDEAQGVLALPHGEYRIVHSDGLVEDDVQLLRAVSKGVLILRVPTRDVSFLTYPSFNRIDRIGSSQ